MQTCQCGRLDQALVMRGGKCFFRYVNSKTCTDQAFNRPAPTGFTDQAASLGTEARSCFAPVPKSKKNTTNGSYSRARQVTRRQGIKGKTSSAFKLSSDNQDATASSQLQPSWSTQSSRYTTNSSDPHSGLRYPIANPLFGIFYQPITATYFPSDLSPLSPVATGPFYTARSNS